MRKSTFLLIYLLPIIPFSSVALSGDELQDDRVHTACRYLLKEQYGKAEEILRNPKTAKEKGLYASIIGKDSDYKRLFSFTAFEPNKAHTLAKEALPELEASANNDALSARILGLLYYHGIGVKKDNKKALQYTSQAAEIGEPMAMYNLGKCYMEGIGTTPSKGKAIRWIRKAAVNKNTGAICSLAENDEPSRSVERNRRRLLNLYDKASNLGNPRAMFERVGVLWAELLVLELRGENQRLKKKLYERRVNKLRTEMNESLQKAAEHGYVPAMLELANGYLGGFKASNGLFPPFVPKQNAKLAYYWHKKAAQSGLAGPLLLLAKCYDEGIGVAQDSNFANSYYDKAHRAAQQQGNEEVLKVTTAYKIARKIIQEILGEPKTRITQGTGFLISKSGIVITNCHVAGDKSEITVLFPSKRATYKAEVQLKDTSNDLVILRLKDFTYKEISAGEIPYALRQSSNVKLGEEVFTLGFPLGDTLGKNAKFSDGSISALNGFAGNASLYQISNPVQRGNSGGPLFDKEGNVVGVVVSSLGPMFSGQDIIIPQNVNFAIKSDYLISLVSMLPASDTILERKGQLSEQERQEQVEALVPYIVTVYAK